MLRRCYCVISLLCLCFVSSGCQGQPPSPDALQLPGSDSEHRALEAFAHQTIAQGEYAGLCRAPRSEIDAKVTLIGHKNGWDQDTLDTARMQVSSLIDETRDKYSPKPVIDIAQLGDDAAIGQAIRDLEAYDQFWASAIVRYPELREAVPESNGEVFGMLFNRRQCEAQIEILDVVKSILAMSDFPTDARFGEGTLRSLRLLVQHADSDVEFQTEMLEAFLANPETLDPPALALLTDRVRVNQGKAQIYGTQLECQDGAYRPKRVEDPATLDERRASVGLEPFDEYAAGTPGCGNKVTF